MELIDSPILKNAGKGLVHWTDMHCSLCKKYGGTHTIHTMHNMHNCNRYNSDGTPKKSSGSTRPHQKDCTHRMQTLHRSLMQSATLPSKRLHEGRNTTIVVTKVRMTQTLISEVLGQTAQGNYVFE